MESTPGKDAMKIVEMTTMDLEYYINLVYTEKAVFERTDSEFEGSSVVDKIFSNSFPLYREIACERKSQLRKKTHCHLIFRKCHSHSNL